SEVLSLIYGNHYNPHHLLGLHDYFDGQKVIRIWRPGAHTIFLEVFGQIVEARKLYEAGLFEYVVPSHTTFSDYRVYHQNGLLVHDPYAFQPSLGELDQYLFGKGVHYQLYKVLGARLTTHQGQKGVKFTVWAPSAKRVSVVGDFNFWDG